MGIQDEERLFTVTEEAEEGKDGHHYCIEIAMCNQDMVEAGCKNDTEIEQLLKSLYYTTLVFTSYFVTEGIDFENEKNLGKRPVSIEKPQKLST